MTRTRITKLAAAVTVALIGVTATPAAAHRRPPVPPRSIVQSAAVMPEATEPRRSRVSRMVRVVVRLARVKARLTRTGIAIAYSDAARTTARRANYARGPPEAPEPA